MEENIVVDTEVVEEIAEVEEITVDEILSVQEEETIAETVAYDDSVLIETLTEIRGDMRIMALFAVLTFCSSCLRAWRNTVVRGVK